MADKPIDVWDAKTFDPALSALLAENAALVRDYMERDRQIFLDHDLGRSRTILRPENAHAGSYLRLAEGVVVTGGPRCVTVIMKRTTKNRLKRAAGID